MIDTVVTGTSDDGIDELDLCLPTFHPSRDGNLTRRSMIPDGEVGGRGLYIHNLEGRYLPRYCEERAFHFVSRLLGGSS